MTDVSTDQAGARLVGEYLGRLDASASSLTPERRAELVAEVREHIAQALQAEAPGGDSVDAAPKSVGALSEATVRNMLDRLGPPEEIVRAEAAYADDGTGSALNALPKRQSNFQGNRDSITIFLLMFGRVSVRHRLVRRCGTALDLGLLAAAGSAGRHAGLAVRLCRSRGRRRARRVFAILLDIKRIRDRGDDNVHVRRPAHVGRACPARHVSRRGCADGGLPVAAAGARRAPHRHLAVVHPRLSGTIVNRCRPCSR